MNIDKDVMKAAGRILVYEKREKQKTLLNVSPVLRVCTAFLCILLCAFSRNAVYTLTVIGIELLRAAFMNNNSLKHIVRNTVTAVIFSVLITLPAVFMGNPGTLLTISMKVMESVLVLSVMNEILSWKEITGAFESLHFPSLFVFVLDLTVRYLVILGSYANALTEAVTLRSVGERSWKDSHIGGILGTTFLKSSQMASANSEAMTCRCFEGTYKIYNKHQFTFQDAVYLLIPVFLVIMFLHMG